MPVPPPQIFPAAGIVLSLLGFIFYPQSRGNFTVTGSSSPVTARLGDSITLPCTLIPSTLPSAVEIYWVKKAENKNITTLFYKDGQIQWEEQNVEYKKRAELYNKSIINGNLSLKLLDAQLADEGTYICGIKYGSENENTSVTLELAAAFSSNTVSCFSPLHNNSRGKQYTFLLCFQTSCFAVGSAPAIIITVDETESPILVCESSGWFPKPKVTWADRTKGGKMIIQSSEMFLEKDKNGLYSIKSYLNISVKSQQSFQCSISISRLKEKKTSQFPSPDNPNNFIVMKLSSNVTSYNGDDVVLPCLLIPADITNAIELHWFKESWYKRTDVLLLYKDGQISKEKQNVPGKHRVQLFHDKIKEGNISLKLLNVQSSDEGKYICSVHSGSKIKAVSIILHIKGTEERDGNSYKQTNEEEPRDIQDRKYLPEEKCHSFLVIIFIVAVPLVMWMWKLKKKKERLNQREERLNQREERLNQREEGLNQSEERLTEREDKLKEEEEHCNIFLSAENVHLDRSTAHPKLVVKENSVKHEDKWQDVSESPQRFDSCLYVLGTKGFNSGNHYWVVNVQDKTEWDLGVAKKSINRKGPITLSPENGFWTIGLCNESDYWARTEPVTKLKLNNRPRMIGVFLQYEAKNIFFYNADSMSLIHRFSNLNFTDDLYPFFNPGFSLQGKNNKPLEIVLISDIRNIMKTKYND